VLELTVIDFAWFFNVRFSLVTLSVIWALGMGMIVLAAAVHLPFKVIVGLGLLLVAGHNLLDPVHVQGRGLAAILWSMLHEFNVFQLGRFSLYAAYPLLPWTGVMILGYCFGRLYQPSVDRSARRQTLLRLGWALISLFIVIRAINIYGDPVRWSAQERPGFTFLSFLNVTKYPPSLLYVLVTLGPATLFLAAAEKFTDRLPRYLVALGRVPMFYYILHLYLIHIVALAAALATGHAASDMMFTKWITESPNLKGYGFPLGAVYVVWIGIVLSSYPLCLWYDRYKTSHREKWWLSYL